MKLIKLCILSLAGFASVLTGNAQTHYRANISVGAKAGADMSRILFSPTVYQKFKPGGVAGFRFRYIEENHFGLIAELNYEQRGWTEDFKETSFNYSRTLNYIQIPVLAHIYFGGKNRFFINAGPEIGFMLSESTNSNFDYNNLGFVSGFPLNRTLYQLSMPVENKVDYGISAGIGGEFSINKRNSLDIEARFYFGLGNIYGSRRKDIFSASNSMSLMATVGYWFRVK